MKTAGLLLLLALFSAPLAAQWKWVNPLPQGDALYDVSTLPDGRIWVTGGSGTLLAWDPSSGNWNRLHTMVERTLFGIQEIVFTDANTGFLLTNGTLLATGDGGRSWNPLPAPAFTVRHLYRAPGNAIWTTGGTPDATARWNGSAWESRPAPISGSPVLCFLSAQELFAAGANGTIAHSTDEGRTWTATHKGAGDIASLSFGSSKTGLALQPAATLLRTMDGGVTWKDTTLPVNAMTQVLMSDSLHGWLVTNTAGIVYQTTNAGATWRPDTVDRIFGSVFQKVSSPGSASAVLIGSRGEVYRTTDFGATWTLLGSAITRNMLWSLSKSPDGAIFAFGDRQFLRSTDEGTNWKLFPHPGNMRSGAALSQARLVAVGDSIWTSADSGKSWNGRLFGAGLFLYDVSFAGATTGWAVGSVNASSVSILRTTDAGLTWTAQAPPMPDVLHAAAAVSASECWAVGHQGLILHTTDAGATWNRVSIGASFNFRAVRFFDQQNGWAGGEQMLYRTTDGGKNWDDLSYAVGPDVITAMDAADPGRLFCMKPFSVMRSVDGGNFFYREDYPSYGMSDLLALPGEKALAVGQNGTILKYEPAPCLSVTPSPLLFGKVEIGKSAGADLILSNRGETGLAIDSAILEGEGFILQTPLQGMTIGARQFEQARISFSPSERRNYVGYLTFWSKDQPGMQRIELRGEGIDPVLPVLRATPNPVLFGMVKINTYAPQKIAITNSGTDAILINSEKVTGPDSTSFYILKESGYFLAAGASDTITLVFRPLATGGLTAYLAISSSDPAVPLQEVELSGIGIAPLLTTVSQTVDFGNVLVNSTAKKSVVVMNAGSADAAISGTSFSGADKALFTFTRQLPSTIAAKRLDSLIISFLPTSIGDKTARLTISSDDPVNPDLLVDLKGRGVSSLAVGQERGAAGMFDMESVYPNPFGPGSAAGGGSISFRLRLAERMRVTVEIYSLLGERVSAPWDAVLEAGWYLREWRPGDIPGGSYFIRVTAANGSGRMTLLRSATYLR